MPVVCKLCSQLDWLSVKEASQAQWDNTDGITVFINWWSIPWSNHLCHGLNIHKYIKKCILCWNISNHCFKLYTFSLLLTFSKYYMSITLPTMVKHSSSIRHPRINAPLNLSGDGITSLTSASDIISLQVSLPQLIIDRSINMSLTHKLRLIFEPFNEAIIQH